MQVCYDVTMGRCGNGKAICLWASHHEYTNDPDEIKIGDSVLNLALKKLNYDEDKKPTESEITSLFTVHKNAYILCFSENEDNLPMWSMYGGNGSGIALGFDIKLLIEKYPSFICKCLYINQKDIDEHSSQLARIDAKENELYDPENKIYDQNEGSRWLDVIMSLLQLWASGIMTPLVIKDSGYEYEKEIRVPIIADESEIFYRNKSGLLIPYKKIMFPKEILKEIIIGPTNDMIRSEKSLRMYLDSIGFQDTIVRPSGVSYRG